MKSLPDEIEARRLRRCKKSQWLRYKDRHDYSTGRRKRYSDLEKQFVLAASIPQREIAKRLKRSIGAIQVFLVRLRKENLEEVRSFPKLSDSEYVAKYRTLRRGYKREKGGKVWSVRAGVN